MRAVAIAAAHVAWAIFGPSDLAPPHELQGRMVDIYGPVVEIVIDAVRDALSSLLV